MKIVFKIQEIIKAFSSSHKYYKREGTQGNYKYYYTKEQYDNRKVVNYSGSYSNNKQRQIAEKTVNILGGTLHQANTGTCYVDTFLNGKSITIRFSDHDKNPYRRSLSDYDIDLPLNINPSKIKTIIKDEIRKQDNEKIKARQNLEKEKEINNNLEDLFNEKFPNKGVFILKRTYQNLKEFKEKNPKAEQIKQIELDNGAYQYKYIMPKNGYETFDIDYAKEILGYK